MQDKIIQDRVDQLLDQMRELYDGDLWYGTTILPLLKQVSPDLSVIPPLEGVHCVQQIVLHMTAWRGVLLKKLEGDVDYRIDVNSHEDWVDQTTLKAENWPRIFRDFQNAYLQMLSELERKAVKIYQTEVGTAGYDFQYLIEGILHHDIYHLGQIALVRKMLKVQGKE